MQHFAAIGYAQYYRNAACNSTTLQQKGCSRYFTPFEFRESTRQPYVPLSRAQSPLRRSSDREGESSSQSSHGRSAVPWCLCGTGIGLWSARSSSRRNLRGHIRTDGSRMGSSRVPSNQAAMCKNWCFSWSIDGFTFFTSEVHYGEWGGDVWRGGEYRIQRLTKQRSQNFPVTDLLQVHSPLWGLHLPMMPSGWQPQAGGWSRTQTRFVDSRHDSHNTTFYHNSAVSRFLIG